MTILDTIVAHKRVEVDMRRAAQPMSSLAIERTCGGPVRDFHAALVDPSRPTPRVIAEIKRRSPSKGNLRADLDPAAVASVYEQNGAAAVSVLVDERFFGGSFADLQAAHDAVSLPVLCKEFIVDPYQIYEAFMLGADAVLLIAAMLDSEQLRDYRQIASGLGMAALVEVHNRAELDVALKAGADIVGINNRDLHTFNVSLDTTFSLLPLIPRGVITVSESGIYTASDRSRMADAGVDALLVGESLVTANDIASAVRQICGMEYVLSEASL